MFAKRNSLTLGIIWLILLLGGVFWYVKDARVLMQVIQDKQKQTDLLKTSQAQIERLTQVETIFEQVREKWVNSPKQIIAVEEPTFTLSYLNWIVSSHDLDINYDFVLNEKRQSGDYTRFAYTLTGEGTYEALNKLIWYLTYRPILYKINNISLSRARQNSNQLRFEMRLQGFTVESESTNEENFDPFAETVGNVYQPQHDIFKPLIAAKKSVVRKVRAEKPKLPPKRPGQIDVEEAKLRAVTPSSVFLSEGSGPMVELKVGDAVYLGKLLRINQQANEAEFVITKFGRSKRVTLGIDARN